MHEMQTIVTDVRGVCLLVCPSISLSRGSTVCGAFVQPLPNYFGLALVMLCITYTMLFRPTRKFIPVVISRTTTGWSVWLQPAVAVALSKYSMRKADFDL